MDTPCCSIMSVISSDILTCSLERAPARPVEFCLCIHWWGLIGRNEKRFGAARIKRRLWQLHSRPLIRPPIPTRLVVVPWRTHKHMWTRTHTHPHRQMRWQSWQVLFYLAWGRWCSWDWPTVSREHVRLEALCDAVPAAHATERNKMKQQQKVKKKK